MLLAFAAACGGASTNEAPRNGDDAGSNAPDARRPDETDEDSGSDSGTDPDADPDPDPDPGATLLAKDVLTLYGVTSDDHVVYARRTASGERALQAVPLGGGTVTTLVATISADAVVTVKGNAVAFWRSIDATTGLGSLSYWTPAGGAVLDASNRSVPEFFWASSDGARIAFLSDATLDQGALDSAKLTVAVTATRTQTDVLTGDERLAFGDGSCGSHIGFAGQKVVAAYCAPGSDGARLALVSDAATPVRRVLVDHGLAPFWSADTTASKIFAVAANDREGRIITYEPTTVLTTVLETGVTRGFVKQDGSSVVYHAGTTLRQASFVDPGVVTPVTLADDARALLDVSLDQSTVLFHSLEGRPVDPQNPDGDRYVDLRTVSTNGGQPEVHVATERALPLTLSADGAYALYFSNGPRFNATALDGTGERSMRIDFNGLATTPAGSAAVLSRNPRQHGQMTVVDLVLADFTAPAPGNAMGTKPIIDAVPSSAFRFGVASPRKLAYLRATNAGLALYSRALP
ncbi:MAG: hypothetical protein J0I07_10020 [Myxococcales bacterium]|nr:hypothetical protein [Myxococcales bacterium]